MRYDNIKKVLETINLPPPEFKKPAFKKDKFAEILTHISGVEIETYEIRENELVLHFSNEQTAKQHIQAIQNYPEEFNVLGYLFCAADFVKECSIENITQKDATIVVDLTNPSFAEQMKDRSEKELVDYLKYRVKERVRRFFLLLRDDFQIDNVNSQEITLTIHSDKEWLDKKWVESLLINNGLCFTTYGNEIKITLDQPVLTFFQGRRFNIPHSRLPENLQIRQTKVTISIGNKWGRGLEIVLDQEDETSNECYEKILSKLDEMKCQTNFSTYPKISALLEGSDIKPLRYEEVLKAIDLPSPKFKDKNDQNNPADQSTASSTNTTGSSAYPATVVQGPSRSPMISSGGYLFWNILPTANETVSSADVTVPTTASSDTSAKVVQINQNNPADQSTTSPTSTTVSSVDVLTAVHAAKQPQAGSSTTTSSSSIQTGVAGALTAQGVFSTADADSKPSVPSSSNGSVSPLSQSQNSTPNSSTTSTSPSTLGNNSRSNSSIFSSLANRVKMKVERDLKNELFGANVSSEPASKLHDNL